MEQSEFDDETLMAYADGVLEAEVARRVAEAATTDPEIAARIEMFRQTGELLSGLRTAPEPLSEGLSARIARTLADARTPPADTDVVVPFPSAPPSPTPWRPLALAASAALLAGVVGGVMAGLSLREDAPGAGQLAMLEEPAISAALDTLRAGERAAAGTGEVTIVSSFVTPEQDFCREFEYGAADGDTVVSVACRTDGAWQARFAVVAPASDGSSFVTASSMEALDAYLSAIGAGAPMSAEQEAALLSAGAD